MDDPVLMRLLERLGDLASNRKHVPQWHGAARHQRAELRAIDQLHHEGRDAVGLFKAVDVCDRGMIQGGEGLGFPLEPFQPLRVSGEGIGQDLKGYLTIELGIVRTIDLAHASSTEEGRDLVDANLPADKRVLSMRPLHHHPGGHLHRRRLEELLGGSVAR